MGAQHLADGGGTGAERHEHRAETRDKQQCAEEGAPRHALQRLGVGEVFQRSPADEAQIGRHQRQDARRQEAGEASEESSGEGYVSHCRAS